MKPLSSLRMGIAEINAREKESKKKKNKGKRDEKITFSLCRASILTAIIIS